MKLGAMTTDQIVEHLNSRERGPNVDWYKVRKGVISWRSGAHSGVFLEVEDLPHDTSGPNGEEGEPCRCWIEEREEKLVVATVLDDRAPDVCRRADGRSAIRTRKKSSLGKIGQLVKELATEVTDVVLAKILNTANLAAEYTKQKRLVERNAKRIRELEFLVDEYKMSSKKWEQAATGPVVTPSDFEEHHRLLRKRIPVHCHLGPLTCLMVYDTKTHAKPARASVSAFNMLRNCGWEVVSSTVDAPVLEPEPEGSDQ